jgi:hypothetical protein
VVATIIVLAIFVYFLHKKYQICARFVSANTVFCCYCSPRDNTPNNDLPMTMYHGTSVQNATSIRHGGEYGLRPSSSGMLGRGVYCSTQIEKAKQYATTPRATGGGVIFKLQARVGKVKNFDTTDGSDPLQHTWHLAGYDTALVPPGVNPSGLSEHCVWDPQRVRIVGGAWTDCGFTW